MIRNETKIRILAFGGGVDSSALCAINLKRDEAARLIGISREALDEAFPAVDAVMFSDTGAERKATYENVARFEAAHAKAGIAFHRVRKEKESITEWLLRTGTIPLMPGGSHLCSPDYCLRYRPAARYAQPIDTTTGHVGFRCVRR